ncbi:MAG TPA: hypothetical protein VFY50_02560 [Candidatus Nitrosocosmicus sp.]|nr:hypothetical protein [Candidatus Nitrosocosmicus sp.]
MNKFYIKHNNINSFKSPSTINKNNNNKKNKISTLTTTTLLIAAVSLALVLIGSIIGNLLLAYAQPQPQQQPQQQLQQPLPPQAQIPVEKIQSKLRERFGCELCDDRDLFMKLPIADINNMNRTELEFYRDWLSDVISDVDEETISDQNRIEQRNALLERLTEFDRILGRNR